jgi:hypothetical protein
VLQKHIIEALGSVLANVWHSLNGEALDVRSLYFSLCVFHGFLASQVFFSKSSTVVGNKQVKYAIGWLQREATSNPNSILIHDFIEVLKGDIYVSESSNLSPSSDF